MTPPTLLDHPLISDAQLLEHQKNVAIARQQILSAFYTTMVIGGLSTMVWAVQITRGVPDSGWNILDVILMFGLGYGIGRNNPLCAKLMFGYFLLSKLLQIFSGRFPPTAAPIAGIIFFYLWKGIVGTSAYARLMETERDLRERQSLELIQNRSSVPTSKPKPAAPTQPLTISPELLSLCGGDRAQAQWLVSQLKIKHPDRSPGWYDRQAIAQLNSKNYVETDNDRLDND